MNQKHVATVVVIVVVVLFAAGYLTFSQKLAGITQYPVTVPREHPNPTLEPLPAPTTDTPNLEKEFLCNSPTQTWHSLIALTEKHRAYVKSIIPDAELFEVQTTMLPMEVIQGNTDIRSPSSEFVSPLDDVGYIKVEEEKDRYITVNHDLLKPGDLQSLCTMKLSNFVLSSGGVGQPEPHEQHLPIRNWKIDIGDIARIMKGIDAIREEAVPVLNVTVSTMGRARHSDFFAQFISANARLAKLPDSQAVIEVTMPQSVKGGFWLLDAETGEILDSGASL